MDLLVLLMNAMAFLVFLVHVYARIFCVVISLGDFVLVESVTALLATHLMAAWHPRCSQMLPKCSQLGSEMFPDAPKTKCQKGGVLAVGFAA